MQQEVKASSMVRGRRGFYVVRTSKWNTAEGCWWKFIIKFFILWSKELNFCRILRFLKSVPSARACELGHQSVLGLSTFFFLLPQQFNCKAVFSLSTHTVVICINELQPFIWIRYELSNLGTLAPVACRHLLLPLSQTPSNNASCDGSRCDSRLSYHSAFSCPLLPTHSPVHWVFFFLPTLNMFTFPDLKDLPDLKKKNHFGFSG